MTDKIRKQDSPHTFNVWDQKMTEDLIQKTRKQIQKNYDEAFGSGLIWAAIAVWVSMALSYALGNTPGAWNASGVLIVGLWYRYKKVR